MKNNLNNFGIMKIIDGEILPCPFCGCGLLIDEPTEIAFCASDGSGCPIGMMHLDDYESIEDFIRIWNLRVK